MTLEKHGSSHVARMSGSTQSRVEGDSRQQLKGFDGSSLQATLNNMTEDDLNVQKT
jgi:hypothetical protein